MVLEYGAIYNSIVHVVWTDQILFLCEFHPKQIGCKPLPHEYSFEFHFEAYLG